MKEQLETRRIAVLLGPKSLGFFKLILKEQSFHTVDLIQSDRVEEKYVKGSLRKARIRINEIRKLFMQSAWPTGELPNLSSDLALDPTLVRFDTLIKKIQHQVQTDPNGKLTRVYGTFDPQRKEKDEVSKLKAFFLTFFKA